MAELSERTPPRSPSAPQPSGAGRARELARSIGLPFLASRLVIWFVLVFALLSLPAALRVGAQEDAPAYSHDLGWLTDVWARWDSIHFLAIAQYGYDDPLGKASSAFYPLYPALVGLVGRILLGHYVLGGLLVSLAACLVAACLLYELARIRLGDSVALRSVIFLGVFPYALFLQAVYSESLFLALAVGAFLAAERRRMTTAAVLTGLAMLTRPTGYALLAALAVIAWQGRNRAGDLARLLIAPALFALYPLFLWYQIGDPLSFVHAEDDWGRSIAPGGPFSGLWQGVRAAWFGARQLVSGTAEHPFWVAVEPDRFAVMNLEILAYIVLFTTLSVIAWRRLGAPYGVFSLACIALAVSAPSSFNPNPLISFPRYAMVIFPAFIALAAIARRPWLVAGIAGTGALLLGVNLLRWAAWQFIA